MSDEQTMKRMLSILEKDGPLSYLDLSERLTLEESEVKRIIGKRFSELTKRARDFTKTDADSELFLIGDNVKEIASDRHYNTFKNFKTKGNNMINWLFRRAI